MKRRAKWQPTKRLHLRAQTVQLRSFIPSKKKICKEEKMQQQFQEEYDRYPKTVRTYKIGGKKYVVTSVYVGNKDFKKVFGNLAFNEALKDTE